MSYGCESERSDKSHLVVLSTFSDNMQNDDHAVGVAKLDWDKARNIRKEAALKGLCSLPPNIF